MAKPFSYALRTIHADSLQPGLVILALLLCLLLIGAGWLFFFPLPRYVSSPEAQVTSDAVVEARFPAETLPSLEIGLPADFLPASSSPALSSSLPVTVVAIDMDTGRVWLAPDNPADQRLLTLDQPGQVQVVVAYDTPFAVLLQAAGLETTSQGASTP